MIIPAIDWWSVSIRCCRNAAVASGTGTSGQDQRSLGQNPARSRTTRKKFTDGTTDRTRSNQLSLRRFISIRSRSLAWIHAHHALTTRNSFPLLPQLRFSTRNGKRQIVLHVSSSSTNKSHQATLFAHLSAIRLSK